VPNEGEEMSKGMVEGLIEALSDKHSQLEVRLQDLAISLGDPRMALHVSGTLKVSMHMRDLTDGEKDAHAAAAIAQAHA
jgi:hypothetical protein